MKLKQSLLLIITTFLILMSANSQAGRQGISFYYGLGMGIVAPGDVSASVTGLDPTINGNIILGFEEDGWALEATAFNALETGTDVSSVDYSSSGSSIGLAYRTIEKKGSYYKIKVSSSKMNFDLSNNSATINSSGMSYAFGLGWRMDRDARLELDYNFYKSSDTTTLKDSVHTITARYFWGGAPYNGEFSGMGSDTDSTKAGPFYMGLLLGQLEPDLGNDYDTATTYGLLFGYDLSKATFAGVSIELLAGASSAASSFLSNPVYLDEYTSSYVALYGVYRSPGKVYVKGRLGYLSSNIKDETYFVDGTFDTTIKYSNSGLSYGAGAGFKMGNHHRLELEYTTATLKEASTSYDPSIISLSYLYNF